MEEWLNGKTFNEAVYAAKNREIDTLLSYKDTFPEIEDFYNDIFLSGSRQEVAGKEKHLIWEDYIKP